MLASLTFLAPWGLTTLVVTLVPLACTAVLASRQSRAARVLGLEPTGLRGALLPTALAVGACVALGLAAGRPVWTTEETQQARTRSELVVVVDVSRSMLASPSPGAKSRLARARAVASRLRAAVPDVPAGLSGLTDRVLPYVFPTIDRAVFEETLRDSVVPEAPPPDEVNAVATSFAPLATLGENGFFARAATRRTCLLVTDGESRGATADQGGDDAGTPALGGSLGGDSGASGESVGDLGCRLIVVRVGDSGDRIYGEDGRVEAEYRPVAGAADTLRALADDAGGRAFSEASLEAAAGALRTAAEFGPVRATVVRPAVRAIAPFLVVLAGVLALLVVAVRLPETLRSQAAQDYHPLHVLRPKKGRI